MENMVNKVRHRSASIRQIAHQTFSKKECAALKIAIKCYRSNESVEDLFDSLCTLISCDYKLAILSEIEVFLFGEKRRRFQQLCMKKFPTYRFQSTHTGDKPNTPSIYNSVPHHVRSSQPARKEVSDDTQIQSVAIVHSAPKSNKPQAGKPQLPNPTVSTTESARSKLRSYSCSPRRSPHQPPPLGSLSKESSFCSIPEEKTEELTLLQRIENQIVKRRPRLSVLQDMGFWSPSITSSSSNVETTGIATSNGDVTSSTTRRINRSHSVVEDVERHSAATTVEGGISKELQSIKRTKTPTSPLAKANTTIKNLYKSVNSTANDLNGHSAKQGTTNKLSKRSNSVAFADGNVATPIPTTSVDVLNAVVCPLTTSCDDFPSAQMATVSESNSIGLDSNSNKKLKRKGTEEFIVGIEHGVFLANEDDSKQVKEMPYSKDPIKTVVRPSDLSVTGIAKAQLSSSDAIAVKIDTEVQQTVKTNGEDCTCTSNSTRLTPITNYDVDVTSAIHDADRGTCQNSVFQVEDGRPGGDYRITPQPNGRCTRPVYAIPHSNGCSRLSELSGMACQRQDETLANACSPSRRTDVIVTNDVSKQAVNLSHKDGLDPFRNVDLVTQKQNMVETVSSTTPLHENDVRHTPIASMPSNIPSTHTHTKLPDSVEQEVIDYNDTQETVRQSNGCSPTLLTCSDIDKSLSLPVNHSEKLTHQHTDNISPAKDKITEMLYGVAKMSGQIDGKPHPFPTQSVYETRIHFIDDTTIDTENSSTQTEHRLSGVDSAVQTDMDDTNNVPPALLDTAVYGRHPRLFRSSTEDSRLHRQRHCIDQSSIDIPCSPSITIALTSSTDFTIKQPAGQPRILVDKVVYGSTAHLQGMSSGDTIISINGVSMRDISVADARSVVQSLQSSLRIVVVPSKHFL